MKSKIQSRPRVVQPAVVADYAIINSVLEESLDLALTKENENAIEHKAGPDNFLKIREIISFASNQDAWLNDQSLSAAADKVSGKLSQHYPSLSQLAIFRIINQATYGWR